MQGSIKVIPYFLKCHGMSWTSMWLKIKQLFLIYLCRPCVQGLPTRLLFSHHNTPASHYLVTLYDESYGRCSSSGLPKLRTWHTDKMGWVPEKSDHPLHGINPYIVFTTYHHGYEFISEFIASSIQFITNNFHFNR